VTAISVGAKVRALYLGGWVEGVVVGEGPSPGSWLVGEARNLDDTRAFWACQLEVVEDGR
jgi:hypothetical protein